MRVLGGTLLVAGTTIGAAILALPVTSGLGGFFPALILFLVTWAFMTYTAFLILEVNLEEREDTNLVSMARRTLGSWGEAVSWVLYLLLLYCLTAAYISGSGALLIQALVDTFGISVPGWVGPLPFVVIFGAIVYLGVESVDHLNRILMAGLIICYLILVFMIAPAVDSELLMRIHWEYFLLPLSVVITAFGFHIILPSLVAYLGHDARKVKLSLLLGSAIPLVAYVIWELLILGAVPLKGPEGLIEMLDSGQPAASLIHVLKVDVGVAWIGGVAGFFGFFTITTSFLGVSLSLSDFLTDGLRVHHLRRGKLLVTALTFIPPLIFAWLYPQGFILALSFGGVIVALLLGLLPICMAWVQRYVHKAPTPIHAPGGRPLMVLAALFFIAVVIFHFTKAAL